MPKKTFLARAQESIAESQAPIAEEIAKPRGATRVEYEGTSRLKEARNIPVERIQPDPNQPRKTFTEEALEELTASITRHGVLQPITVEYIHEEDYFRIISGERRYRAAQRAGLTHLPCIIRTTDQKERLAQQLIENIQREDLSPIDKARGLLELKSALGKNAQWKDVEGATGLSERRRRQFLALLDLPEQLQKEVVALGRRPARNQVTEKHARALLRLRDYSDKQLELFERIKHSEVPITGDQAIRLAKEVVGSIDDRRHKIVFTYRTVEDLVEQLEAKLGELKALQKSRSGT